MLTPPLQVGVDRVVDSWYKYCSPSLWHDEFNRKQILEKLGLEPDKTTLKDFTTWMVGKPQGRGKILNMHYLAVMQYEKMRSDIFS